VCSQRWCVVTPFKDRWDLLETFLHWYKHVWGVRTVCVLMGYTQPHHLQSTLQRLQTVGAFRGWTARSLGGRRHTLPAGLLDGAMWYESVVNEDDTQEEEDGGGWRVYVLAYRTSRHTAHDTQWRPLFRELNALVHAQLPAQLDRIMAVDSDEYLCVRTTLPTPHTRSRFGLAVLGRTPSKAPRGAFRLAYVGGGSLVADQLSGNNVADGGAAGVAQMVAAASRGAGGECASVPLCGRSAAAALFAGRSAAVVRAAVVLRHAPPGPHPPLLPAGSHPGALVQALRLDARGWDNRPSPWLAPL
jgi:hypothetical protein